MGSLPFAWGDLSPGSCLTFLKILEWSISRDPGTIVWMPGHTFTWQRLIAFKAALRLPFSHHKHSPAFVRGKLAPLKAPGVAIALQTATPQAFALHKGSPIHTAWVVLYWARACDFQVCNQQELPSSRCGAKSIQEYHVFSIIPGFSPGVIVNKVCKNCLSHYLCMQWSPIQKNAERRMLHQNPE